LSGILNNFLKSLFLSIAGGIIPITSATITTERQGVTPVSYYSTYKEPSAYTEIGVGSFARISGISITSASPIILQLNYQKQSLEKLIISAFITRMI
jgi:hypothetical protein